MQVSSEPAKDAQLSLDHEHQVLRAANAQDVSSFALYFDGECYLADCLDENAKQLPRSTAPGSDIL